ncbi:MAG: DUF192 domain-containing protein [Acidobacteriaceae bacterium]
MTGLFRKEPPAPALAVALNETRGKSLATHLEVADNSYTRRKGLLGRDGLEAGSGLWIYPCESVHTFAMRFAIDLVYLDRDGVVKKLRSSVPPGRLSACFSARSVIELPAGTIEATGTEIGDRIAIGRVQAKGVREAPTP